MCTTMQDAVVYTCAADTREARLEDIRKATTCALCALQPVAVFLVPCYIDRVFENFNCSWTSYVCALVYMDRYSQKTGLALNGLCLLSLWLICLMIAVKFSEDDHFKNAYYADVGGLCLTKLNALETHLLFSLDFKLDIEPGIFESYDSRLKSHSLECITCDDKQ